MTLYHTDLIMDVTDTAALEISAIEFLEAQGKTEQEIQDILFDDEVFQIVNALTVLYKPAVVYNGTTLLRIEVYKYEGE